MLTSDSIRHLLADPVIVVHGGAGKWQSAKQPPGLKGVRTAAREGFKVLKSGGSAIDAVESSVMSLEDNPVFNAGTGSTLNFEGEAEMDAAIMNGSNFEAGAVALVRAVKNPIRLARLIMEKTDHTLIAGYGAERIAAAFGLPIGDVKTKERMLSWNRAIQDYRSGRGVSFRKNLKLLRTKFPFELGDTVGALAWMVMET